MVLSCSVWAEPYYATGNMSLENQESILDMEAAIEESSPQESGQDMAELQDAAHTVTFHFAGGKNAGGAEDVQIEVEDGQPVDKDLLEGVQRTGYLLEGWIDAQGNAFDVDQKIQNSMEVTAVWKPITYRVRFEAGKGTVEGSMEELVLTYDKEQALPLNTFYRSTYAFDGWQYGDDVLANGAKVKNLASEDGAEVTLTATWRKLSGTYTVQFVANGGTGKMDDMVSSCGKRRTLPSNKYKRTGYTFAGWNTQKDGKGITYANKGQIPSLSDEAGKTVYLYAMWKGIPYTVTYNGNGATSGKMAATSHVYGTPGALRANAFQRKGYQFNGWNTKKDGKGKSYKDKEKVKDLASKEGSSVTLYAKWKTATYKVTYKLNGGKLKKAGKKSYTIKTKTYTLPIPTRKGYDFDGWYKDAKFKKRIGEIKKGSAGNLALYAKWVKGGKKAKSNSAKITQCKASGKGKITVKATLKSRIASSDDKYYLVYVDPFTKKLYRMAEKTYKNKKITFTLKTAKNQGYATSMFGIAIKKDGKYKLISKPSFVSNVEKAATNVAKHKAGKTKKGIQHDIALSGKQARKDLKLSHMFTNIHLSEIYRNPTVTYTYNGKKYKFADLYGITDLVRNCNKEGIVFTAQLLLDWVDGKTYLIAPEGRAKNPDPLANGYYQWNVRDTKAREEMEAIFCYLGEIFGQKDCYITNWILGNEVNCPVRWNYAGNVPESKYMKDYAFAFRALYSAVRSQRKNSSVFICTDHYWNFAEPRGYSAKNTIDSFAKQLNSIQKGVKWNLAFHPYSHPLTYTNVWEGIRITNDNSTESITMKNLNVLTDYMKKTYGSSVRIILSELGYTSTSGQANQAAAIAYSYYMAACNPMVDAFIIRSYSEQPVEVAQGLAMGIHGKEAYNVFKYMDQSNGFSHTNRYLGVVGAPSWQSVIPGFRSSRITKMYRK